jgi:hypothetical protein
MGWLVGGAGGGDGPARLAGNHGPLSAILAGPVNFFSLPGLTTLASIRIQILGIFKLSVQLVKQPAWYITYRPGCLCSDGQMAIFLSRLYNWGNRKLSRPVHCTLVEATAGYMYVYLWSKYAENFSPVADEIRRIDKRGRSALAISGHLPRILLTSGSQLYSQE